MGRSGFQLFKSCHQERNEPYTKHTQQLQKTHTTSSLKKYWRQAQRWHANHAQNTHNTQQNADKYTASSWKQLIEKYTNMIHTPYTKKGNAKHTNHTYTKHTHTHTQITHNKCRKTAQHIYERVMRNTQKWYTSHRQNPRTHTHTHNVRCSGLDSRV